MIARRARVTMILSAAVLAVAMLANAQSKDPFTVTQRNALSADGKSRTVTSTGTDAQGQKVNNVAVFEKQ